MILAQGNSWDPKVVNHCTWCGVGKLCKTCHRHAKPRGQCDECPKGKIGEPLLK
jgi:hypothetical protein